MDATGSKKEAQPLLTLDRAKLFSDALDNISSYVYIKNRQHRYVHANKPTLELFGCTAEELAGSGDEKFFPPDTVARLWAVDERVLERGESTREEIDVLESNGKRRIYWEIKTPIYGDGGAIIGLCGISYDITERKKAEEELKKTAQRLANAQKMAKLGDWTMDLATGVITWSDEIYRMLGLGRSFVPTYESFTELIHPDDRWVMDKDKAWENISRKSHDLEYRVIAQDTKEPKYIHVHGETVFGPDGKPVFVFGTFHDITERKQAEREKELLHFELGRKATEMEAILASQNDVILSYDLDMRLRQVNPSFFNTYGFDPVGLHVTEIIRRVACRMLDDSPVVLKESPTPRALGGEKVKSALYKVTRADGATAIVETSSMPMHVGGKIVGTVTVWHDITERYMAEEALHKGEALFHNYFEIGQVGMAITSVDQKWVMVNDRICRLLGYSKDELTKMTWTELTYPDDLEPDLAEFRKLLAGEIERYEMDKRFFHKGGAIVYTHLTVACQRRPDRSVEYVIASVQDITARKELEQEIRRMGSYNRSLIEASLDPLVTIGPDGNITDVNAATEQLTGYPREKLIGTDFSRYFTDPDKARKGYQQVFRDGRVIDYPLDFLQPGGGVTSVLYNASLYRDEDGRVAGVFAAARDITARKKMEEALIAAKEKAEEATKLKDKFVSLVAHDLRGPLGAMMGMLKILGDESLGQRENRKLLESARMSSENMLNLIEDLLSVSRVKAGKLKPNPKFISTCYLAAKAVEEFRFTAERKGIRLVNNVRKTDRLFADEALLYEVMHNLISNALKFSRSGSSATIFVPEGDPSGIAVRDEGVGIEKERLEHLFEYETKTSTIGTGGELGTGLGLPLSKDIVEAHGGKLIVESVKGKGSTFIIRLPLVKPKILVVDDDEVAHNLLMLQLRGLGAEIIEARDGREALAFARYEAPHLMIVDLLMPLMDGYTLIANLKDDLNTASIPIIVVTSDQSPDARNRCFRLGVQDFIAKPIIEQDISARVKMLLGLQ